MNLLKKIIENKQIEVALAREERPISRLVKLPLFNALSQSFSQAIQEGNGIIAEFKRKSPSAGELNKGRCLEEVVKLYNNKEVTACSILTDANYFGGSVSDLIEAKKWMSAPILRKDFIIDEYQLFEAKAYGADAVLLIAEALDEYHAKHLGTIANSLGLEVLMEFHSAEELYKLNENVDVIGINNRNLKTLKTDVNQSFELIRQLPFNMVKIAESGIQSATEIDALINAGYDGFLIGESILKNEDQLSVFIEASEKAKESRSNVQTNDY